MGSTLTTPPTLMIVCAAIHTTTVPEARRTNVSGVVSAMRTAPTSSAVKSSSTVMVPMSPSSSPMIAKMKSVCASGRLPHFSRLAPSPRPHQPPDASANMLCAGCQPAPW